MRPVSETLKILIATADDIMRRPLHTLPTALPPGFAELAAEIRRIDARPAEGLRATRSAIVMVSAIEGFFAGQEADDRWQMVIGAALPILRREAFAAWRSEREVMMGEGSARR
jgi:hypothetical protein